MYTFKLKHGHVRLPNKDIVRVRSEVHNYESKNNSDFCVVCSFRFNQIRSKSSIQKKRFQVFNSLLSPLKHELWNLTKVRLYI